MPDGSSTGRPWWQQWWAIIATLVVCFPFGLIGIWQRKDTSAGVKVSVTILALVLYSSALAARTRA
jgi:hypothetical protein